MWYFIYKYLYFEKLPQNFGAGQLERKLYIFVFTIQTKDVLQRTERSKKKMKIFLSFFQSKNRTEIQPAHTTGIRALCRAETMEKKLQKVLNYFHKQKCPGSSFSNVNFFWFSLAVMTVKLIFFLVLDYQSDKTTLQRCHLGLWEFVMGCLLFPDI